MVLHIFSLPGNYLEAIIQEEAFTQKKLFYKHTRLSQMTGVKFCLERLSDFVKFGEV